ncbi:unnamed protein product [Symbiodinium sp. CCMP2592]|nr:unnamed protein product [Symbiodinium sp. CCMP2592]
MGTRHVLLVSPSEGRGSTCWKPAAPQRRGNVSGELFQFNPPSYTIVDAPPGSPWSGGREAAAASASTADQAARPQSAGEAQTKAATSFPKFTEGIMPSAWNPFLYIKTAFAP